MEFKRVCTATDWFVHENKDHKAVLWHVVYIKHVMTAHLDRKSERNMPDVKDVKTKNVEFH